jgi:hypothetical protein
MMYGYKSVCCKHGIVDAEASTYVGKGNTFFHNNSIKLKKNLSNLKIYHFLMFQSYNLLNLSQ